MLTRPAKIRQNRDPTRPDALVHPTRGQLCVTRDPGPVILSVHVMVMDNMNSYQLDACSESILTKKITMDVSFLVILKFNQDWLVIEATRLYKPHIIFPCLPSEVRNNIVRKSIFCVSVDFPKSSIVSHPFTSVNNIKNLSFASIIAFSRLFRWTLLNCGIYYKPTLRTERFRTMSQTYCKINFYVYMYIYNNGLPMATNHRVPGGPSLFGEVEACGWDPGTCPQAWQQI